VSDDRRQAAQATVIVLVNPQTMTSEELINEAPPSGLGATSVGLPVVWIGTNGCIARTRPPNGGPSWSDGQVEMTFRRVNR